MPFDAKTFSGANALGNYLQYPEYYPASSVIAYDDNFVSIYDRYPKSFIHTLLIPRSEEHIMENPFVAFQDEAFLNQVKKAAEKLRQTVANDLERRFRKFSKSDHELMSYCERVPEGKKKEGEVRPPTKDWLSEVKVGIHAVPSMSHIHVHVLTRDSYSESVKTAKHYSTTPFACFPPPFDCIEFLGLIATS